MYGRTAIGVMGELVAFHGYIVNQLAVCSAWPACTLHRVHIRGWLRALFMMHMLVDHVCSCYFILTIGFCFYACTTILYFVGAHALDTKVMIMCT